VIVGRETAYSSLLLQAAQPDERQKLEPPVKLATEALPGGCGQQGAIQCEVGLRYRYFVNTIEVKGS
jgi:hypothetical protein